MQQDWWEITSETITDTPFLAVYTDRIHYNIDHIITEVKGDVTRLRPHIKTHKMGEVLELFKDKGINKVKCATIAEAELCAMHHIPDILLAYQPTGAVKQKRWLALLQKYTSLSFSTITDNFETADELSKLGQSNNQVFRLYLDMNVGMNRTGVHYKSKWNQLVYKIAQLPNIRLMGLHIYDGHLHGSLKERFEEAESVFSLLRRELDLLQENLGFSLKFVAGGSGTFPFYAAQKDVECSPGTFVFWDTNYRIHLPEQKFFPAAVLVGTIISKPSENTLCVDLGYKSVASENSLDKRLTILNDENLIPVSHSEEHLVLENTGDKQYRIGELIYAVPYHICPTCALYDTVQVVNSQHEIYDEWTVLARKRKINI
ncbi:alanine racemase [Elizabethkingia meningoseptica]|uniref:D-TA family PLP-dependent enzyme n=2 Tax=Elizabethkingia meningoseptica TaxID=238 RepID=UPI00036EDACA|nr:D-TA family PLP-dependent enzyme [Elizabethkingia meningoseptica]AQX06719.1 alanine racemase [Elizabethkingia meningoseptica]AQX48767.1 alanine racemase [Elizabethkingia meningoseptica]KUY14852.1 alanine racemase [Elizabethkingia meningoseptica]MDE5488294.1 D-TA family PLP-dependent enzyme [Elizabethkingia meningoseptica]MVW93233.1 D-TA family PLP-dependent enzyme [Elizabethkingia meningoseptica]